ncbi:MAG: fumarylacetoacetate hydrolase family protein [Elusimicrobiota bacterium]|jgi:2-keto-4-pentenoate hydratase/2-oxohepta-3-ene-1,7-dioic acid hydratase in catechol pathway
MKLATANKDGEDFFGLLTEQGLLEVRSAWPEGPESVLEALQAGPAALARMKTLRPSDGKVHPLSAVRLRAPILRPPKLIGLAVNYAEHHKEFNRGHSLPENPKLRTTPRPFLMPGTCVLDPGADIPWPSYSRQIDYEIELAAVIGRTCKDVSAQEARECIAGYTIANDVSARSVSYAEGREKRPQDGFFDWLHGKWADGFCPLGPWIVTSDEIPDARDLRLELWVDEEKRQDESTRAMIFDVYELVSFCSRLMRLEPGDVIATGTPSGVGMPQGKLLQGGSRVRCRIQGIGELVNTMGRPPKDFFDPFGAGKT